MSRKAESLVWDRARAKGSDLLMLVCIADYTNDEGRYAWPSVQHLARVTRMSERGAQYVLHRLEEHGEIAIDWNADGRAVEHRGREFTPMWFLHVRCVFDWDQYQQDGKPAKVAGNRFKSGRRPAGRKPGAKKPQIVRVLDTEKPDNFAAKPATSRTENPQDHDLHIRKDPLVRDPSVDPPARVTHRKHAFCPTDGKGGFCVPDFLHRELDTMLGLHAGDLDLLFWYIETDRTRRADQPTVLDGLNWWREQLRAEIVARGWAPAKRSGDRPADVGLVSHAFACPHDDPKCGNRWRCAQRTALDVARAGRPA